MLKPILLLICIACLALSSCNGKVVQGHIKSPDNWVFINKFCYANDDPEFGLFGYTVTVKPTYQNFQLLLYFDSDNSSTQWDAVYRKDLSCIDKEALRAASEHITPPAGSGLMEIHTEYRPHWRYVVAADCSSTTGLEFDYTLNFTQADGGQFSLDEAGLLPVFIVYFIFFIIIGVAHIFGAIQLHRVELYHFVVRCLTAAMICAVITMFSYVVHYGSYSSNGVGFPALKAMGDLLSMMMDLSLIIAVILLSKGMAVTLAELGIRDKIVTACFGGLLGLFYLLLFIWDYVGRDPAASLYVYDSWPGWVILSIRLVALMWFVWNLYQTLKIEQLPTKRLFYTVFGCAFAMWFLFLPFAVLLGSIMPSWYRQKGALGVKTTLDFLSITGMTILMWPTFARRYLMLADMKPLLPDPGAAVTSAHL